MGNNTYYLMGPLKSMYMESEIWHKAFVKNIVASLYLFDGKSQSHICGNHLEK